MNTPDRRVNSCFTSGLLSVAGTAGEWADSAWGGLVNGTQSPKVCTRMDADSLVQPLTAPEMCMTVQPVSVRDDSTHKGIKAEPVMLTDTDTLNNLQCEQVTDSYPSNGIKHEIVRDSDAWYPINSEPVTDVVTAQNKQCDQIGHSCMWRSAKCGPITDTDTCAVKSDSNIDTCAVVKSETITDTDTSAVSTGETNTDTDMRVIVKSEANTDTDAHAIVKSEKDIDTDTWTNIKSEAVTESSTWTVTESNTWTVIKSDTDTYRWTVVGSNAIPDAHGDTCIQPVDDPAVSKTDTAVSMEPLPPREGQERLPSEPQPADKEVGHNARDNLLGFRLLYHKSFEGQQSHLRHTSSVSPVPCVCVNFARCLGAGPNIPSVLNLPASTLASPLLPSFSHLFWYTRCVCRSVY